MPLLDALCDYIETSSAGLTEGTNLFKSAMPDSPDACVALYEYPGRQGAYTFGTGGASPEYPRIQIVSRNAKGEYDLARATLETVKTFLDGKTALTLGGVSYLGIFALQSPFQLPPDAKGRARAACNFEAIKAVG